MIAISEACRREIEAFPEEIRGDLADALARLDAGLTLSMPLSRPMPSIGRGAHELRLRGRSGSYRVAYAFIRIGSVHVLHAFKKNTGQTPSRNLETARRRLKEIQR